MTAKDLPTYDQVDRLVDEDPLKLRDLAWALRQQVDQLRVERDWLLAEADDDTRARYAEARSADGGEGARR